MQSTSVCSISCCTTDWRESSVGACSGACGGGSGTRTITMTDYGTCNGGSYTYQTSCVNTGSCEGITGTAFCNRLVFVPGGCGQNKGSSPGGCNSCGIAPSSNWVYTGTAGEGGCSPPSSPINVVVDPLNQSIGYYAPVMFQCWGPI
ncbi:MAG: hypothetical protein F8N15_04985 [Methanobacterium sp.]|nr:hypothetical protein [Methanobacterium sp.]